MLKFFFHYVLRKNKVGSFTVCADYKVQGQERVYKSMNIRVKQKHWDSFMQCLKKGHPNFKQDNETLEIFKNQVYEPVKAARLGGSFTPTIITSIAKKERPNLFQFVHDYLYLNPKKLGPGTLVNHTKMLRKLKRFVDPALTDQTDEAIKFLDAARPDLTYDDFNDKFLVEFEAYLRASIKDGNATEGYIAVLWGTLIDWFKIARKNKATTRDPFETYKNPVATEWAEKDYLSLEELYTWEKYITALPAEGRSTKAAREVGIYLLFGCYTGFRYSDWKQFDYNTHIANGRIKLRPNKTKNTSGAWVEMKVREDLARILELVKFTPISVSSMTFDRYLKKLPKQLGINKKITTHVGRKTFAITMCADKGITCSVAAEFMGITEGSCYKNYYRLTDKRLDAETEIWDKKETA